MSDYTLQATWSTKDALATGQALKAVSATELGTEFDAIAVAITSKYDVNDLASQAQAEAEAVNTVLITPLSLGYWSDNEAGVVGDLQDLTVAGFSSADAILGWDTSAGAAIGYTLGEGITSTTTDIWIDLSEFSTVAIAAADTIPFYDVTGLVNGKTTVALLEAGFQITALADYDANKWVDHTGVSVLAASGSGLAVANDDLSVNIGLTIDYSGLTAMTGADIVGADTFLVDDGGAGTNKKIAWQDLGVPQTDDTTTSPLSTPVLSMANRWFNCSNASAIGAVIPSNASVAFPVGTVMAFHQRGAGQVTVSVTTDTLRAPVGAKTSTQYSTIFATKIAATEWTITGQATL